MGLPYLWACCVEEMRFYMYICVYVCVLRDFCTFVALPLARVQAYGMVWTELFCFWFDDLVSVCEFVCGTVQSSSV
jgi:hypothetical protein